MNKLVIVVAAALLFLAACGGGGGGGGSGGAPVAATPAAAPTAVAEGSKPVTEQLVSEDKDCTVAYWGDSISGLTAPHLDKRLEVTPHAVFGGTAAAAQMHLLQDPMVERFIVIQYGTNDANAKDSSFPTAMRSMLTRVKAMGKTPVLTGLSNATAGEAVYRATFSAVTAQFAGEFGAIYADWPSVPWSASDLRPDGVHPTEDYQQRLANKLSQVILDAAPECQGTS